MLATAIDCAENWEERTSPRLPDRRLILSALVRYLDGASARSRRLTWFLGTSPQSCELTLSRPKLPADGAIMLALLKWAVYSLILATAVGLWRQQKAGASTAAPK